MALHGGCLYFHGGCQRFSIRENFKFDFLFDSDVYCLDLRSQTWSRLFHMIKAEQVFENDLGIYTHVARGMFRHGLVWYDNKLYVIGSSQYEMPTGDLEMVHLLLQIFLREKKHNLFFIIRAKNNV